MEVRDRFDSLIVILEVELFVRRMQVIIVEAKAHEDNLDTQLSFQY